MKLSISFRKTVITLLVLILFLITATSSTGQTVASGETLQSTYSQTVPVLDSQIDTLEWADAQKVSQSLDLYDFNGNKIESHPFDLYIKNDDENLYIAGSLKDEEHDGSMNSFNINSLIMDYVMIAFDNDDNGIFQAGEDKKSLYILNQTASLHDEHLLTSWEQQQGRSENSEPQNTLGTISYSQSSRTYTFETAIPLASGDASDIQILPGQKVRWNLLYMDKFNLAFSGTTYGGLNGKEWENTSDWGYIQLGVPVVIPPAEPSQDIQIFGRMNNERDLETGTLQFIGSHFDLVLNSFPFKDKVTALRQQNPDIKIFLFTNPYFSYGDDFWDKSPSEVRAAEQKYSLKTDEDQMILYGGPIYGGMDFEQRVPLMDVVNPQWQDYFAAQTRKWVDYGELDGVYLDTLTEDIPLWALAPGGKYPKGFSKENWKTSNHEFLTKIKNAFSDTDKKVLWNGITRAPGDTSEIPNKGMLDQVDGTFIEAFSVYLAMDENEATKRWYFDETVMKDLKETSEQGKIVTIEVYGNRDDVQTRLYALTTYLLVQNARTYFYFTKMSEAGDNRWRPEWDVKLGQPLGAHQVLANGAYTRDFEKGKVLVNPLSTSVVVTGLGAYKNWQNGQQINNMTLPPYSGALLVSSN